MNRSNHLFTVGRVSTPDNWSTATTYALSQIAPMTMKVPASTRI
jgi:hypothetical protein